MLSNSNNNINEKGLTKTNGVENKFEIFDYNNLGQVRISVGPNQENLFCLVDVCNILGITNSRRVMERLNLKGVHTMNILTNGGVQKASYIY